MRENLGGVLSCGGRKPISSLAKNHQDTLRQGREKEKKLSAPSHKVDTEKKLFGTGGEEISWQT